MTRTVLAIAAALFAATTFTSGANACISCEYVPPVVNTPVYSHGASHYKRKSSHSAVSARRARAAKLRLEAKAKAQAKAKALARAEAKAEAKALAKAKAQSKIETAKAAPVEVESENSAISTASVDKSDTAKVELAPSDGVQASKAVGCKKFFPTVGMTLSVPCE